MNKKLWYISLWLLLYSACQTTNYLATAEIEYEQVSPQTSSEIDGDIEAMIAPYRNELKACLLYTSPSPRDRTRSRMPSSA